MTREVTCVPLRHPRVHVEKVHDPSCSYHFFALIIILAGQSRAAFGDPRPDPSDVDTYISM